MYTGPVFVIEEHIAIVKNNVFVTVEAHIMVAEDDVLLINLYAIVYKK